MSDHELPPIPPVPGQASSPPPAFTLPPSAPPSEEEEDSGIEDLIVELQNTLVPFGRWRDCYLIELGDELAGYLEWVQRMVLKGEGSDSMHRFFDANEELIVKTIQHPHICAHSHAQTLPLSEEILSKSQREVAEKAIEYIQDRKHKGTVIRIQGGAGYGKTFLLRWILHVLTKLGFYVNGVWAPSYVATCALEKSLEPLTLPVMTLAKGLKLRQYKKDAIKGYQISTDTYKTLDALRPHWITIIDECSMVDDNIARLVLTSVMKNRSKLIIVGDRHQLPPIQGEGINEFCKIDEMLFTFPGYRCYELTEPQRFTAGSPLHRLERGLVEGGEAKRTPLQELVAGVEGDQVELVRSFDALVRSYVESLPGDSVAVFWKKDAVTRFNTSVRRELHGVKASVSPVLEDEILRILASFDYLEPTYSLGDDTQILFEDSPLEPVTRFYSGTCYQVDSIEESEIEGKLELKDVGIDINIPHYIVTLSPIGLAPPVEGRAVRIMFALDENKADGAYLGGQEYNEAYRELVHQAQTTDKKYWPLLHALKELFVPVQHGYAMTAHRAQGSTRSHVFTSLPHLWGGPRGGGSEGSALRYVALTRGSKKLTVAI